MPDAELRAELAAAQLVGIAMLRYVIKVEPLASADLERDRRPRWRPTSSGYLTEPVTPRPAAPDGVDPAWPASRVRTTASGSPDDAAYRIRTSRPHWTTGVRSTSEVHDSPKERATMPELRSRTVTHGRNMAGARALMRASGVARADIGKPIIAVANSFTEFVPGHTHLQPVGRIVSEAIKAAGGIPREFNTIAVDDGIAMGHGGMLYSPALPRPDRRLASSTWSRRTAPTP